MMFRRLLRPFYALIITLGIASPWLYIEAIAPAPSGQALSEEEILLMEAEMKEQIDAYVKSLPPEEQELFHQMVAEETKKMESMSEDELTSISKICSTKLTM